MFVPTFADYVNSLGRNPDMTQAQWDALSPEDKWSVTGGVAQIRNNDPRYNDLAGQTGGEAGRNLYVTTGSRRDFHGGLVGNEADLGNGVFAHNESSQSPQLQAYGHTQFDPMILGLPLAFMGAGMLANGGFGGLAGGAGASGDVTLPGMLSNFATPEIGALNLSGLDSAMTGLGYSGWGSAAGLGSDLSQGFGPNGALDPETAGGAGGMGVSQNGIGPGSFMDRLTGAINNPSSLLSNAGSLMPNSVGGWLQAIGGAQSLAGLLGGNRGNSGGSSNNNSGNSSSDKGGNGKALNVTRGQYTPNPITQQQLQNFRYAQPRGLLGGY